MNVRVVFLDLGDTLVEIAPEILEDSARQITTLTGHSVSAAELKQAERAEWQARSPRDFLWVKTEEQERTFWEKYFYPSVLRRLGISDYPPRLVQLLAARAMDPRSFVLFPEVEGVLDKLRQAGVELGIISNSFPSAEKILKHLKLTNYFRYIIWSHQCGCAKPEKKIFNEALQCVCNFQASTLFIDDRPEFVQGAKQAGIEFTFWVNRNGYNCSDDEIPQIHSLWEIVPLVVVL